MKQTWRKQNYVSGWDNTHCDSKKFYPSPKSFLVIFLQWLWILKQNFKYLPYVHNDAKVHNFIQLFLTANICMRSNVRTFPWTRLCALTDKFSSTHLYCAACAHNRFLLLSPVNDERGEQLAVTPVPRTSSGPMQQLKLNVCALSASSNSYKSLQLSEYY